MRRMCSFCNRKSTKLHMEDILFSLAYYAKKMKKLLKHIFYLLHTILYLSILFLIYSLPVWLSPFGNGKILKLAIKSRSMYIIWPDNCLLLIKCLHVLAVILLVSGIHNSNSHVQILWWMHGPQEQVTPNSTTWLSFLRLLYGRPNTVPDLGYTHARSVKRDAVCVTGEFYLHQFT